MEAAVAWVAVSISSYRSVPLDVRPSRAKAGGVTGDMSIIKLMEKPKLGARGEDHHAAVTDSISIIVKSLE